MVNGPQIDGDRPSSANDRVAADLYQPNQPHCGHEARIFNLQFRPGSSTWLASASDDNTVGIWRRSAGRLTLAASYRGHADSVMRVSWNPADPTLLASGSSDTTVHLWRLAPAVETTNRTLGHAGCRPLSTLKGHPEEVYAVEWLSHGSPTAAPTQLAVASGCSLFLWDLETQAGIQKLDTPQPVGPGGAHTMPERWREGYIFGIAQQPGGSLLGAACSDGALRFWGRNGGAVEPLSAFQWNQSVASDIAFSGDGSLCAATAKDGSVLVMDSRQGGQCLLHQQLPVALFSCSVVVVNERQTVMAAGADGRVHLVDVTTGAVSVLDPGRCERVVAHCATLSGDGSCIAAAGEDVKLDEWDVAGFSLRDAKSNKKIGGGVVLGKVEQKPAQRKWSPIHVWDAVECGSSALK